MCIEDVSKKKEILRTVKKALNKNGELIVVITHPCFRQYEYLPFYTSYTEQGEMNYFNNGEVYEVKMKDKGGDSVTFQDFHWNLTHTLNLFIEEGFQMTKFNEVKDISIDGIEENKLYSPFIIMSFKEAL